MSVEIGLKGRAEETVTDANTAQAACSGKIGEGTHQRFIVTDDRFLAKAARKLEG